MDSPVLLARELRWRTRLHLAGSLGCALVSVTLRAPSTLRQREDYAAAFESLCLRLEKLFASKEQELRPALETRDAEGPARHYAAGEAHAVKALCVRFEEEESGGELLDIDVMAPDGSAVSRGDIGCSPRACLVCGARPAAACIAGRRHSASETQAAFSSLLRRVRAEEGTDWPEQVANFALRSLLYEVSVSPKPGLVDRESAGAHSDMDYYSFLDSAAALAPYFLRCARVGQSDLCAAKELLSRLRPLGLEAEAAMRRATGGANTHKGLIFSLGILCAAAGRLGEAADADSLCCLAAEIAAPALKDAPDDSHGDLARGRYGALGARGEAAGGFASARAALPLLRDALAKGEGLDRAGALVLAQLLSQVNDTNVLYRAGEEGLRFVRQGARALLERGLPPDAWRAFCDEMTRRGISPGGCADLLAITFFLQLSCLV